MRGVAVACLLAVGCHAESPRSPQDRCTLRISQRGTYVDGTPMSRADAIAHCKSSPGGAVVVIEDKVEWDETRTALQRAGVRIYVRERVGDEHGPAPAPVIYQPRREIVADPPVVAPPAPSK